MLDELFRIIARPAPRRLGDARDERACRQHQRGVRGEVCCHFNSIAARANADRAALAIRRQQHQRHRKNVREKVTELMRGSLDRMFRRAKGQIVVSAETLEPRLTIVPHAPAIEFLAHESNLFPEQSGCAETATGLELNNRRCDFDHAGVEVNRAARRQLKRTAGPGQHSLAHKPLWRAENFLRPPMNVVYEKLELSFQPDDGPRWRPKQMRFLYFTWVAHRIAAQIDSLHSRGVSVTKPMSRCR